MAEIRVFGPLNLVCAMDLLVQMWDDDQLEFVHIEAGNSQRVMRVTREVGQWVAPHDPAWEKFLDAHPELRGNVEEGGDDDG